MLSLRCLRLMLMASSSCHGGLSTFVGCHGLVVPALPPTLDGGSFRPASLSRSTSSHICHGTLKIPITRKMRGGRVLCGYFGVKDYFASFDNNDENADESKGGLFDVNSYLSSLGNNAVEEVDNDSAGGGGSTSVWSSQMQQQESGLLDVNNYLSSLGNNAADNHDKHSAGGGGSTSVWSSQMQQQESGLFDVNNYLSSLGNNAVEEAPVGLG